MSVSKNMNVSVSPAEIVSVEATEQIWVEHECMYEFVC